MNFENVFVYECEIFYEAVKTVKKNFFLSFYVESVRPWSNG